MNPAIRVRYYDGKTNFGHAAELSPYKDGVLVCYEQHKFYYQRESIEIIGAIGKILPVIELPDDARIELLDGHIPDWLNNARGRMAQRVFNIENSWHWIAASLVGMLAIIAMTIQWGIPLAAHAIAMQLPAATLQNIGNQAQQMVIDQTEPSQLSPEQQNHIRTLYREKLGSILPGQIIFRHGGATIDANALAIPNGNIIVTDELILLAKNDNEILGVLAHEQGHLIQKHSLQQVLRGMGFSVLYVSVTGDAISVIGALPAAIVTARYSQEFELQADAYAVRQLQARHIPAQALGDFLQRLSAYAGEEKDTSDFLQSHPATQKRMAAIQAQIARNAP